jgi:hypothetical protein
MKRMQRVVDGFGGILVGEPSPEYAVWLVADTQLNIHGAAHYKDLEWQDDYVLCCGPDGAVYEVPEGAKTIHIPTSNGRSIYADQAVAIALEHIYGTSQPER